MAWLLIDNSNTRTKFALGDEGGLLEWRGVLNTAGISPESLAEMIEGANYSATIVCSVVPEKAAVLRKFFESSGPVHFLGHESPLGMNFDYPDPASIGADRLANAAAAITRHRLPAIVIDMGTATTFDVISEQKVYCGGVIAPGLGAVAGYLPHKTALLPATVLEEPVSAIGKCTVQAMQVGAIYGYRGLVREILVRIRGEISGRPVIIATGGDAALVARGLPEIDGLDPELTLEGLRQVARRLFPSSG